MQTLLDVGAITEFYHQALTWLMTKVLVFSTLIQAIVVVLALIVALVCTRPLRAWLRGALERHDEHLYRARALRALRLVAMPLLWLGFLWIGVFVAHGAEWPLHLLKSVGSLLTAWVLIRLTSQLVRDKFWGRFAAVTLWTVAALNIVDLLEPTLELMNSLAINFGSLRLSLLTFVKGLLSLLVLVWLASVVSGVLERRFRQSPNLTPSVQVLLGKLTRATLIVMAILVAVKSVGIDLTAFTVFSGALGVGIGFGLQKIIANLVSGVILLLEKSIKPGDVIAVDGTYGSIESFGARYASVVTRDGSEYLIPNEDLITQRVENWSHRDDLLRLKIPVGVSYRADVRLAIQLCLDAASEVERVLPEPKSVCLMKGFGDSSVDLELRFWIRDPQNGVSNIKSQILLLIWDKFHEHDIEIPFPQRDLHVRSVFGRQDDAGLGLLEQRPSGAADGSP
jgi:small-conductance mechanosensitive channel